MDSQEFIERYVPFARKNWLALSLGILGLILLGYGLISFFGVADSSKNIVFEKGGEASLDSTGSSVANSKEILADIEGAVASPGVYHLAANSRIKDLLVAAQGLSSSADRNWVAKNLNLAAKLADGSKVYIPFLGEKTPNSGTNSSLVNINTASEKDLDILSGVGPATAEKIINGRPYAEVDELLSKKIVGNSVFEKIKDKITVY